MLIQEKTVHAALVASARRHGGKAAFHFFRQGWRSMSYEEFLAASEDVSLRLLEAGPLRGARVALVAENRPEWCAAWLGILLSGGIAVPVDARLTPAEARNIIAHSEAVAAVHSAETSRLLREASPAGVRLLDLDLLAGGRGGRNPHGLDLGGGPEDTASLLYTSGTTGNPKAVMLSHGNLLSDAEAVMGSGLVSEADNVLSVLPLHHTYPFMCTFLVPLLGGGSVTYPAGIKGPEIAEAARETGVTVIVAVPRLLELMRNRIMEKAERLPFPARNMAGLALRASGSLRRRFGVNLLKAVPSRLLGRGFRFFACGGARLDPGVMEDMEALGFTVVEGYGLTETSPLVSLNPLERRKPGSAGQPVPSAEIRIISGGQAGEGEVAIKGPMVTGGYYKNPEATAAAFRDGWFLSGDLGYLDDDGYLFITGRKKELIVLASGKNVYPEEVEDHYAQSPLIKELCVLEEGGGLRAVVVPDDAYASAQGIGNINEELRWEMGRLSSSLPPHMRVAGYTVHHGPLPRTPLGKLRRFMVGELLKGKPPGRKEDDPALVSDETGRAVAEKIRALMAEPGALGPGDNLELDLGLDSLKRLELASSLEEAMGIKLPDEMFSGLQSVGDVVGKVRELMARGVGPADEGGRGEEERLLLEALGRSPEAGARALHFAVRAAFRVLFGLRAEGLENLPEPPFIIAPNHSSYLDGFAVSASLPYARARGLHFQGLRKYFSGPLSSRFARLARVIPLDPARFQQALRLSAMVIERGGSLCIFPEGGRSYDGELMDFKKGIGALALKTGAPVVPARIRGTFRALPRGARLPRPGRVTVAFGRPFRAADLDMSGRPEGTDEAQFVADELRKRVSELA
ncbi:MAG: AMP-binding protein [Thermodesulfovibrionales bacterium]